MNESFAKNAIFALSGDYNWATSQLMGLLSE